MNQPLTLRDTPTEIREAAGSVIDSVDTVLLSHEFAKPLVWSGGVLPGFTAGLVRITTADGTVGLGESYGGVFVPRVMAAVVDHYRPLLLGEDPSKIQELWNRCYSRSLYWGRTGVNVSVLSAIESALWDICGKRLDKPVHELLGGAKHRSIKTYASAGMDDTDTAFQAEQRQFANDGYRANKIRIGRGVEPDVHKVELARQALGPDYGIAADAVQGSNPAPWEADEAIEVGRSLEGYDLLWLEEPCAADDYDGHRRCREELDIPIAGGETLMTAKVFNDALAHDAFDIAQPDVTHIGGLLEFMRVANFAESKRVPMAMHVWGCGVGMMANYHGGFAATNCEWLEHPAYPNPLRDALLTDPLQIVDGRITLPTAPGLGVVLPPEVEATYSYAPGRQYRFGDSGQ